MSTRKPGKVETIHADKLLADALKEREQLINALALAKPFVCEAAAKMRPARKIEAATKALEAMHQWRELFP